MNFDLHIHTTHSDGTFTVPEIVEKAKKLKLNTIAITDHDTLSGLKHISELETEDLKIIPGIEFSIIYKEQGLHLLGYFINPEDLNITKKLEDLQLKRQNRANKIIEKLKGMGMIIDQKLLSNITNGSDSFGRPHIAKALQSLGYVQTVEEAFDRFIGKGGPAFVPNEKLTIEEAIKLIHQAGGVAILAHPYLSIKNEEAIPQLLKDLISLGLDGVEVFYPKHTDAQIYELLKFSKEHGLKITGGSDFHGLNKPNIQIGQHLSTTNAYFSI